VRAVVFCVVFMSLIRSSPWFGDVVGL